MKKRFKISFYIRFVTSIAAMYLCATMISSCNRNSDQLPTITPNTLAVTIPYVIDNYNVNFIYKQVRNGEHDTEWVMLQNNNDQDLTNITAFVQICNALPQNLTNCTLQKTLHIDTLKKNSTSALFFLYSDQKLVLDKKYINAGIISSDLLHHPLGGVYYSDNTVFEKKHPNDTGAIIYDVIGHGGTRGYIFADGKSVFMFSGADTSYSFSFTGTFDSNLSFNGDMVHNGQVISAVGIDTFSLGTAASPNSVVKWKIATITSDSVNFISDVLIKSK